MGLVALAGVCAALRCVALHCAHSGGGCGARRGGRRFGADADALVMARPVWFKTAVWLELVVQLPFYCAAIYAFLYRREWIRVPAVIYASSLLTIMTIILAEQFIGEYPSPKPGVMLAAYAPWALAPALILARVWTSGPLFPAPATKKKSA